MAFLTEDNLMRTISLERVVAPIATHLFYLLLLSESEADTEQFTQLEVSGCAVAKASRNMANVASRVISESDDDIMRIEMSPLLESLIISGQQVLLETQKLSIQPEVTEHRGELVKATQNVLLGVLKILLVEDDATIRKITAAAHWLLASLSEVGVATNLKSLLKAFQLYSKAMLLLHNLVMERIEEVCDYRCQSVKASVGNLRSCISMLHTAVYLTIKHPTSEEALGAKKYIFHLVNSTVNDIIITLKSNCKSMHRGKYGHYTGKWKMLLKLLSDREFSSFIDSNFDIVLLDLVVYSKAVANCSRKEIQSCLTANCRRVLHLWLQISQQIKGCKDKQKSKVFQDNTYVSLIQQIHKLDEAVVKATIYLVMDTFVLTSNPIEQFVNTTYSLPENDPYGAFHLDPIQPLSKSLIVYTDRIFEVASFVSALAFDEISVENVENSMSCLNYLKDSIIVLLQELREDSVQYHRTSHKLNHFYYKWVEETKQLQNAFCEVINVKNIIHPFVQEMNNDLDSCVEAHKDQDFNLLRKYMRFLTVRMNQVICFVRRHLDKSDDPIYRNGLLILVRQAEHSVAKVTGYATDTFNTNFHGNAFSLLTDSAREAIKVFDILYKGLDGLQHPHLLSPLREAVWQPATTRPVLLITEPQKPTDNQELSVQLYNGNKKEELVKCNDKENKKENVKHITSYHFENNKLVIPSVMDSTSAEITQDLDLLPLLCELVHITKAKDVEALNTACTGIVELSSCYTQATEEATCIVEGTANQEIKILRSKLVALTPLLVQTAQETAMSSARSTETVYRHSTQFSDLIKKTKKILLPVVGMWYFAVQAMIHGCSPNITDSCIQELTEVMCLCTDTVQLVMSANITVSCESNIERTHLISKLKKAQNNTKHLTDHLGSKSTQSNQLDGPCILWALTIQVLLSSVDRALERGSIYSRSHLSKHQMTQKKKLANMLENSLRIQEAASLSSSMCKDSYKVKLLKEQQEVKILTEVYLQAAKDLDTTSRTGVLLLARAELLHRQLQIKMKALSCLLRKVNEDYITGIQNVIFMAWSVKKDLEVKKTGTHFETNAELLLENVQTAISTTQDCFHFIRDPQVRSSLRYINDQLLFQMSEILSKTKFMVETQTVTETLSLDIQTQSWSAKAHYLVQELYKVNGISHVTIDQIKLGLQGKECSYVFEDNNTLIPNSKVTPPSRQVNQSKTNPLNILPVDNAELKTASLGSHGVTGSSSVNPIFTYTSVFIKQEAKRWDVDGNHIVKVTKEMAEKIHQMTLYLKRKGPIQSKDAFVALTKDLIMSSQTITQFVKVIADYCLDKHSTKEMYIISEQILTVTNQLTILSSVNAVTPMCKSSDEILVKNAQSLLQTVIQVIQAVETACIKGIRQPEHNSEAAKAASLCIDWKKKLLIHRAQEQMNTETDNLGLRKTSLHLAAPSLTLPISVLKGYK